MKRLFLLCAVIGLCHFDVFCQKKYEMVIEKTNGEEVVINTEDIVRTYFRERNGGNTPDSHVEGLSAVDLGLPSGTKWANINVGAGDAKPLGGYYSWGEINEKTSYYWKIEHLRSSCYNLTRRSGGIFVYEQDHSNS